MKTHKQPKNTFSTIQIRPSTIDENTSICCNLQPNPIDKNSLIPLLPPSIIASGNYIPFHSFSLSNGNIIVILLSETQIYYILLNEKNNTPSYITTLNSTPYCAVTTNETTLLMTYEGIYRIDYDSETNSWTDLGIMPQFPGINIEATNITTFSASTNEQQLSDSYRHWQGTLSHDDTKSLTTNLILSYNQIQHDAATCGFFIQPILARYHLLDKYDNILYSSTPTMVSAPNGFQCIQPLTLTTNNFSSINRFTLNAYGFQIKATTQPLTHSPWAEIVASVIIETTPILDPIDIKTSASCRLDYIDASTGEIIAYMPGASIGMSPSSTHCISIIKNALSSFSNIASEFSRFPYPYIHGIPSEPIALSIHGTPAKDEFCHRFSAHTATSCGDTILWGNIINFSPFAPSIADITLSTLSNSGFWRGYVSITFASGTETIVWSGEGEDNCPTLISPLLAYPNKYATKMTIGIACGETILKQSFPLTPMPNYNYAIYINSTLTPIKITQTAQSFIIPTQYSTPVIKNGSIAVSRPETPLNLTAMLNISSGDIMKITPAVRSSSAWDFARTHAYVFTTSGIYATSVNATHSALSAHIIDNRQIMSPHAVSFANNLVYAIASNDLISISGSKSTTIKTNTNIEKIAWDNTSHLLWASERGQPFISLFDSKKHFYSSHIYSQNCHLYSIANTLLINSNEILYKSTPQIKNIDINWRYSFNIPQPHQHITLASFFISASQFNGEISLRCHNGTGIENSYPITTLNISGAINAPIPIRIYPSQQHCISISISGNTSPDFQLHNIQVLLSTI